MTIFFCFPCPKFFLSGTWGSVSHKGRISFLNPLLNLLLRFSIVSLRIFLYLFPSLHAFSPSLAHSHSRTHKSAVPLSLSHATRAAGLLAMPTRGERMAPRRPGRLCWRRWTWLLSTESRQSYTMGPYTHMSNSVADWGRGTLRLVPSQVGGPQSCDGLRFISVLIDSIFFLCFVVMFQDLLIAFLWMSMVLPG